MHCCIASLQASTASSVVSQKQAKLVITSPKALQLVCLFAITKEAPRGWLGNELRPPFEAAACHANFSGSVREGGRERWILYGPLKVKVKHRSLANQNPVRNQEFSCPFQHWPPEKSSLRLPWWWFQIAQGSDITASSRLWHFSKENSTQKGISAPRQPHLVTASDVLRRVGAAFHQAFLLPAKRFPSPPLEMGTLSPITHYWTAAFVKLRKATVWRWSDVSWRVTPLSITLWVICLFFFEYFCD